VRKVAWGFESGFGGWWSGGDFGGLLGSLWESSEPELLEAEWGMTWL